MSAGIFDAAPYETVTVTRRAKSRTTPVDTQGRVHDTDDAKVRHTGHSGAVADARRQVRATRDARQRMRWDPPGNASSSAPYQGAELKRKLDRENAGAPFPRGSMNVPPLKPTRRRRGKRVTLTVEGGAPTAAEVDAEEAAYALGAKRQAAHDQWVREEKAKQENAALRARYGGE